MWLLDTQTYLLKSFSESDALENGYAILSHTWATDEVLFSDIYNLKKSKDLKKAQVKQGWIKLQFLCQQALGHGLNYAWLDTCCIDKSSSAELSEAINSMYRWYKQAAVCYAFLPDVTAASFESLNLLDEAQVIRSEFARSRWFTRGWTLQELLAPRVVSFFIQDWTFVGTRSDLAEALSYITSIPTDQLGTRSRPRPDVCVARKLSWAAKRETARPEDLAYCLLGLFDINMPLLYGEGGQRAFERLQLEILRRTHDFSILIHRRSPIFGVYPLFAAAPAAFASCGTIIQHPEFAPVYRSTVMEIMTGPHIALKLRLPTYLAQRPKRSVACLGFLDTSDRSGPIALELCNVIDGDPTLSSESSSLLECNIQGPVISRTSDFIESTVRTIILTSESLTQRSWIRDLAITAEHVYPDRVQVTLDSWCAGHFENLKLLHSANVVSVINAGSDLSGRDIGCSIRFTFVKNEVICLAFRHGTVYTGFFLRCQQHEGMHALILYQVQQGGRDETPHILKDDSSESWKWHLCQRGDSQYIAAGIIVDIDHGEKLRAYAHSGASNISPPTWQFIRVPIHEYEQSKKDYDEWSRRHR